MFYDMKIILRVVSKFLISLNGNFLSKGLTLYCQLFKIGMGI